MHRPISLISGLICGMALSGTVAHAGTSYAEVYARAINDDCTDAATQADINECADKLAGELQNFEQTVQKAVRKKVLSEYISDVEQRDEFIKDFDRAAIEWRKAVDLECHAEGTAMRGTGEGQAIADCIFRRADNHIRSMIEEYRLEDELGPLPRSKP